MPCQDQEPREPAALPTLAAEIEAAIDKLGANRTAVELYLDVVSDRPSAGPSDGA